VFFVVNPVPLMPLAFPRFAVSRIKSLGAQFAQAALERRIGVADAEPADLLPASLDFGLKFAPVITEIVEGCIDLLLRQGGKTRAYFPGVSSVRESIDYNLDDFHLFSPDPGDTTAVQFDWPFRVF
jgi:hypothetical protein